MNIPKEVLAEIKAIEKEYVGNKIRETPLPFRDSVLYSEDYEVATKFNSLLEDCLINGNAKTLTTALLSKLAAYDKDSCVVGQFLLDNLERTKMYTYQEAEAFLFYFEYDCNMHKLRLVVRDRDEYVYKLDRLSKSNVRMAEQLKKHVREVLGVKSAVEDKDYIKYALGMSRDHAGLDVKLAGLQLLKSIIKLIPVVMIHENRFMIGGSYLYKDMIDNNEVLKKLGKCLSKLNIPPNPNAYYTITGHVEDIILKRDIWKHDYVGLDENDISKDSLTYEEIRKTYKYIISLDTYLESVNMKPSDGVYYYVFINKMTRKLWLKRDLVKSPKRVVTD